MIDQGVEAIGKLAGGVVLVYGGTFDPPHRAHVELPSAARTAVGAELVLYVPAGRSPHKASNPIASDTDRLDMLSAALADRDGAAISSIELVGEEDDGSRPPSYTVGTLAQLAEQAPPGVTLRLLIGADQAAGFHRWREPARIIELAEPVVMLRSPAESREGLLQKLAEHWLADEASAWAKRIIDLPQIDVSATQARELLAQGELDHPDLIDAIPQGVLAIIRERCLYS